MASKDLSKIKIALLGHGAFSEPIFREVGKHFEITDAKNADAYLVANFGKIISSSEISKLPYGAINVHGSILPKYRGASPIQTALANGDTTTGITIILMDEKVDHGPMLAKKEVGIDSNETTDDLYHKLGNETAKFINATLENFFTGKIQPIPQNHAQASFTQKLTSPIELSQNTNHPTLYNYYRAYNREPGLFIDLGKNGKLKILKAKFQDGRFIPISVQKPGKKSISYQDFLNGYRGIFPF